MQARTEDWRGRAARLTLAVVVHIIAVILAYFLSPPIIFKKPSTDLQVVMLPPPGAKKASAKQAKARAKQRNTTQQPKLPAPQVDTAPLNMMYVSSDVFRASDIAKIHSKPDPTPPPAMAAADQSIGVGPDGHSIYQGDWSPLPTDAELRPYLPKGLPTKAVGTILCKMIANDRVDECREVSESPEGSGMARFMRLAAWQFHIRTPRIDGKPLIGSWVRIELDLTTVIRIDRQPD